MTYVYGENEKILGVGKKTYNITGGQWQLEHKEWMGKCLPKYNHYRDMTKNPDLEQCFFEKTALMKQQELIEKQSAEILSNLLPLMIAMNIQENGKNKGADPLKGIFSDTEILEWSEYIADISAGNISAPMPELNPTAKKIFKL